MTRPPSSPLRGPTGRAPLPPAWLHEIDLPIDIVEAGAPLTRVHRLANDPVFFGPGAGHPPTYRFDCLSGAFGVLYLGLTSPGALVETLLRNPKRRMVAYGAVASRASSDLRCSRALSLARLHGDGLQRVGCDNAISTGPYDPCGAWADALWSHPAAPDGIAYRSRHDPGELCLTVFERPALSFDVAATTPLLGQLPTVSSILGRYGKSIAMPSC